MASGETLPPSWLVLPWHSLPSSGPRPDAVFPTTCWVPWAAATHASGARSLQFLEGSENHRKTAAQKPGESSKQRECSQQLGKLISSIRLGHISHYGERSLLENHKTSENDPIQSKKFDMSPVRIYSSPQSGTQLCGQAGDERRGTQPSVEGQFSCPFHCVAKTTPGHRADGARAPGSPVRWKASSCGLQPGRA